MDWHELMKKKVTELREMGKAQGLEGTSGLAKEKLVEALAVKLGIERPHKVVAATDKTVIKQRIRALRAEVEQAVATKDRKLTREKRRRIHHLKRRLHKAAALTH